LAWTASTDNVGVTGYDIYVDGVFNGTTATTAYTITGLSPTTTYSLTVLAKDGANNTSAQSTPVNGTTTALSSNCASETFTNIGVNSSTYTSVTWTGDDGGSWNATDARTDQTLTGKAITIRNGVLTAPTTANGIGDLTVTTQLVFSGSSGSFSLKVNGSVVGSIPYSSTPQTTTITGINISGNVSVVFDSNSGTSNRVIFDDLSWTCYTSPDTQAPTAIIDLSSSNTTSTTTDLAWSAATDNVGVTSYEIFKDGVFLASSATNTYSVTGLTASTSYNFTVYAKDAAGNTSTVSNTATVTTTTSSVINELFISEYVEGSGNNKAIEIANFTGASVDLSNYSIKKQVNGAGNWVNELILSGTLNTSNVYVIGNSGAVTAVTSVSNITVVAPIDFNGNDPVGLFKNGVLIDIVGTFNGGSANFAKDVTKRRIGTITSPNTTYTPSEWNDFAIDTFSDLGIYSVTLSVFEFIPNLFSIFPNPATAHTITILVEDNTEVSTIQFYNLLGQQMINIQQPKITQNRIEIKNIPTGMYIVKIANENSYSTKRLIVQ
ncbi:fibronectin type III domain-containing protein, partial [Lutibacter sp.]